MLKDMCSSVQIVEPKRICQNQSPVNKVLRCLQLEEKYPQRNMPEMLSGNSNERRRNEDDKMHQDAEIRRRLSSVPSQQNYNNPARRFNVSWLEKNIKTQYNDIYVVIQKGLTNIFPFCLASKGLHNLLSPQYMNMMSASCQEIPGFVSVFQM